MSDRVPGFRRKSIEAIQKIFLLKRFPAGGGRFCYPSRGLSAGPGRVVLFHFKAHAIASAVILHDSQWLHGASKKSAAPAGVLHFDPESIEVFTPWDDDAMRMVWPGFRGFGHGKQRLNPGRWPAFRRGMRGMVRAMESAAAPR